MKPVIETVTVNLAPGASEASFLEACRRTEEFLRRQPGFVWRRILALGDGRYMDVLEWRGRAEADAAMAASMSEPCMAKLMELIDPARVTVVHHEVVLAA